MRTSLVVLAALASFAAQAQDLVLVSVDPTPVRFNSSTATLTPELDRDAAAEGAGHLFGAGEVGIAVGAAAASVELGI